MINNLETRQVISSCMVAAGLSIVSGIACAQASVTLYGALDASVLYTSHSLNRATGTNSGHQISFTDSGMFPSNFGIRGVEDLGGETEIIFNLESGISTANGALANSNGNFLGRQAWIGARGPLGTFKAGLQFSPFFLSVHDFDPRGDAFFGSGLINYVDNVATTGLFNSNAVSYTSPELYGVQASALVAPGGVAGDFREGRQYSASLRYHLGGLVLGAALYSGNSGGTAASTPIPSTTAFDGRVIGASYRFGNDLVIDLSYTLYKVAGSFDNNVYAGGFNLPVTPFLSVDAGVWYTRDGNNGGNHSILTAAGVQYFLSKRTNLYAQIGYVDNHGKVRTGLSINNALAEVAGSSVGTSIGIRHTF